MCLCDVSIYKGKSIQLYMHYSLCETMWVPGSKTIDLQLTLAGRQSRSSKKIIIVWLLLVDLADTVFNQCVVWTLLV